MNIGQPQSCQDPVSAETVSSDASQELIRVLLCDDQRDTLSLLENALWIWPHRITVAGDLDDAERLCHHLTPTAVIVAVDSQPGPSLAEWRKCLPNVPIIALGNRRMLTDPAKYLGQGADAVLGREDAHSSTLYEMLVSASRARSKLQPQIRSVPPTLALPWRHSSMIGALICDVQGIIVDTNECLVDWLGYGNTDSLLGRCIWRDLLVDRNHFSPWKLMAGDSSGFLRQEASVLAYSGQMMLMEFEIFAAPGNPTFVQGNCVDRTEIAMLTGRAPTDQ